MPSPRLPAVVAGCFLALSFFSGCSNYRLGTGTASSFRSLYVEPVANRTLAPQAQALVSAQVREAFLRDGRVQPVNTAEAAEARLALVITGFRREIATAREDDTGLARKFNLSLTVTGTLRDARDGRILWEDRPFTATREVFTDSGQLQSEYEVMPLLAGVLAQRVVQAALDTW